MTQLTCDPLDALNEALCHEQEGQAFYQKAAKRTVDRKGVEMFRSLADDAALHIDIVQRQIDALTEGDAWLLPECVFDCRADLEAPLYPRGEQALKEAIRPDASDLDALLFALKTENDSFDLYRRHALASEDARARQLYEYLAEEARSHFNLLMLNYESLSSMGGWVD
ncbi:MAG: ferritin family protein [Anaerolineae bacterium]|nr:ferritin family protein [Anaerolineae bacterium]